MTIRKIPAAGLSAAALAGPAFASDLPSRKAPPMAPILSPAPVMSWSGFYAGVNLGGVFGGDNRTTTGAYIASTTTFPAIENAAQAGATSLVGNNAGGVIGGLQVGYNMQFTPQIVGGFEADFQGSSLRSSGTIATFTPVTAASGFQTTISASSRLNYLATLRSRLGFSPNQNWLLYIPAVWPSAA